MATHRKKLCDNSRVVSLDCVQLHMRNSKTNIVVHLEV